LFRVELLTVSGLSDKKNKVGDVADMNIDSGPQEFRDVGVIQQLSASLIRIGQIVDGVIVLATLHLTITILGESWRTEYLVVALIYVLIFEIITSSFQMYRSWRIVRLRRELSYLLVFWFFSSASVVFFIYAFYDRAGLQNRVVLIWLALSLILVVTTRIAIRMGLRYARSFGYDARKVAFVGATGTALKLRHTFITHPWMGMNVGGIYDDRKSDEDRDLACPASTLSGTMDELVELARDGSVDIVYVCLPMAAEKRIQKLIGAFSDTTVSVFYCPSFFNFDLMNARWDDVFGQPVISVTDSPFVGYSGVVKRFEDLVLLCAFLPLVATLMIVISIAIKLTSKGPVFFKQSRCGLAGQRFVMWKFRTMYVEHCGDEYLQATKSDARVTPLGKLLRATSLDELPQFINVMKGDMSFIGPRPHPDIVNDDLRSEIHQYMMRHKVRPGITGLAQISGFRGETETLEKMEARIEHDLEYIRKWSVWLDIKILFRTLFVFRGSNVY
jgi:putative colanic acid biosynthesis UDP-glucose lipid carrier transferase